MTEEPHSSEESAKLACEEYLKEVIKLQDKFNVWTYHSYSTLNAEYIAENGLKCSYTHHEPI